MSNYVTLSRNGKSLTNDLSPLLCTSKNYSYLSLWYNYNVVEIVELNNKLQYNHKMATNKPYGDNQRKGAVKARVQVKNPKTKLFVKINRETDKFMDNKAKKNNAFKGVTKLKKK